MFLTVTANSAIDQVIFIDQFVPNTTMRTDRFTRSIGGKGMDIALVLKTLNAEVLAAGLVAGRAGEELERMLDAAGIPHALVRVQGETRTAHVIVETDHNRHSHITTGTLNANASDFVALRDRCGDYLKGGDWLLCAGSLPATAPIDYYKSLIALAAERGCSSLIDTSGAAMRAALRAKPTIVKLNRQEFAATFDLPDVTLAMMIDQARQVYREHKLNALVITCGSDGLLALTPSGELHAVAPPQIAVNAAGAGDAATAALAYRLNHGDSWDTALTWAAAAGAATVLTDGTAECHLSDVIRLQPAVNLRRF